MLKLFSFFAVLALLATGAAYYYVGIEVDRQLTVHRSGRIPAVYSDHLVIDTESQTDVAAMVKQLENRRYRQVSTAPDSPGEYRAAGGTVEVFTREHQTPDGSVQPAIQVSYVPAKHSIMDQRGITRHAFALEPMMVAPLGSGDLRASSFKSLDEIPKQLQQAVIAIEDARYYDHFGVDLIGIMRAMAVNVRAGRIVQGGSTLTQQLAKNVLFGPERTMGRKVKEALAAVAIERRLNKDQILELYLNEVYLGQEGAVAIHGVGEAAHTFFNKQLDQLTLAECAMLGGLIKAPSAYSPRRHLDRLLRRKDLVLDSMLEMGFINQAQHDQAKKEKIKIVESELHQRTASYFVSALQRHLESSFNFDAAVLSGLSVYTGVSPEMQSCAEHAVTSGLERLEKTNPSLKRIPGQIQAALVAIEPYSGRIKAWVGGRDFSHNQFDRVDQSRRQIGSTIKPFLYLTALDANLNNYRVATPATILPDRPLQIELAAQAPWEPANFDHEYRGDVTLRYALENSLNLPAAYTGQRVGIQNVARVVKSFRIMDAPPEVPALALGAADTSLLQLTSAYGALANGGIYVTPRLFLSAVDSSGKVLSSSDAMEERIADENAVYVLTNILQGVVERGTAHAVRALGYSGVAAGKTGTSNEARDMWFVGFTPNLSVGVWVGFDDNRKTRFTGGAAAVPIWTEFMKCTQPYRDEIPFLPPGGVSFVDIDKQSGELATQQCPGDQVIREVFVRGTEPTHACPLHGGSPIPDEIVPTNDELRPAAPPPPSAPSRRRRSFWELMFGE